MIENWKPVVGYESLYEVSDQGRVKTLHRRGTPAKILKQKPIKRHSTISLRNTNIKGGKSRCIQVARLVLAAFVGPCPPEMEGAHNDGNGLNNSRSNLRYDTHLNNMRDKHRHGTNYKPLGELHHLHILTEAEVSEIFSSAARQMELAELYQVNQATISDIKTGRTWSHITGKVYQPKGGICGVF